MNTKSKIIAFFGKSAAGKDTLAKAFVQNHKNGTHLMVSHTTRPKRDYEKEGIDYYFITEEDFTRKLLNYEIAEATDFRGWFYGTSYDEIKPDKINVGVFNKEGIECLLEDKKLDVYPVYIEADEKTRLIRSLEREKNPDCNEVCRRYLQDEKDFRDIPFEYYIVKNNDKKLALKRIDKILKSLNVFKEE